MKEPSAFINMTFDWGSSMAVDVTQPGFVAPPEGEFSPLMLFMVPDSREWTAASMFFPWKSKTNGWPTENSLKEKFLIKQAAISSVSYGRAFAYEGLRNATYRHVINIFDKTTPDHLYNQLVNVARWAKRRLEIHRLHGHTLVQRYVCPGPVNG